MSAVGDRRDCPNCRAALLGQPVLDDLDVTITTTPPMVRGPYTIDGFTCPHGVTFWIEPTSEQIAEWARDCTP